MTAVDRFRAGVEAGDLDLMMSAFAPGARLYSPVKFRPFEGVDAVRVLLGAVMATFTDFRYVGALEGTVEHWAGGAAPAHTLVFRARVDDAEVHGIDLFHLDSEGLVDEITVMVRPQSAGLALGAAVLDNLPR